jgi:hypothetical protein
MRHCHESQDRGILMKASLRSTIRAAAAALAAAAILGGCGEDVGTPESAAADFVKSAYAGDVATMFSLLGYDRHVPRTDEQLKDFNEMKGKLRSMSAEMLRDTRSRGGLREVKAVSRKCDEKVTSCEITVKVTYRKDPREDVEHVKVAKDGRVWRPVLL